MGTNKKGHITLTSCHRDLNAYKETTSGGCVCLPRRLTWLQAGGTTTTCSYFLETKAAADRPKAQPKAHLYLLRLWEKLGGRSSLTAWQQRSDIGCQASRITCAAPAEHLTPATGARLQCPRVQDNCNNRLLLCRGAMRSCCRVRRTHRLRWSAAQPALLYLAHTSPPTGTCSACLCQHTNPLWWTCQPVCVPQVHNPLHSTLQ